MAFPTTSIIDNFNRSENPLSTNWTGPIRSGQSQLQADGASVATTGGSFDSSYRTDGPHGPGSEAYATVVTLPAAGVEVMALFVRMLNLGGASLDGYYLEVDNAATFNAQVFRVDNNADTNVSGVFTCVANVGDTFGIEATGTTINTYRKPSGGAWGLVNTFTDTTYQASGVIGIELTTNGVPTADDFGGGTIVVAPNPSALSTVFPQIKFGPF